MTFGTASTGRRREIMPPHRHTGRLPEYAAKRVTELHDEHKSNRGTGRDESRAAGSTDRCNCAGHCPASNEALLGLALRRYFRVLVPGVVPENAPAPTAPRVRLPSCRSRAPLEAVTGASLTYFIANALSGMDRGLPWALLVMSKVAVWLPIPWEMNPTPMRQPRPGASDAGHTLTA
jgi:hypothetical protein